MLMAAIALISSALVLYTSGVWGEHRAGTLKPRHAVLFGAGLLADVSGTFTMSRIATAGTMPPADATAAVLTSVMAVTGAAALALMAIHLAWAIVVLVRNKPSERAVFHRFSLVVWAIWLVPYVTGMVGSML